MGEGSSRKPLTHSRSWAHPCALSRRGRGHERQRRPRGTIPSQARKRAIQSPQDSPRLLDAPLSRGMTGVERGTLSKVAHTPAARRVAGGGARGTRRGAPLFSPGVLVADIAFTAGPLFPWPV